MIKQERQLLSNLVNDASYWQRRYNQTEYERKQPHKQENQNVELADIILLWILGIIGFIAMLVAVIL